MINALEKYVCHNEFDPLKEVIMCPPTFMRIEEVINDTQATYADINIDVNKAQKQFYALLKLLKHQHINVQLLPPQINCPEQVFVRDVAFQIGGDFFIANMAHSIRRKETNIVEKWLQKRKYGYTGINDGYIEGGDILVDTNTIWAGLSDRTNLEGVESLSKHLPNYIIKPIPFNPKFLHLDCVFNIISHEEALVYLPAFSKETICELEKKYNLISIEDKERETLATNILTINKKEIISISSNRETNRKLTNAGYKVIEVDLSEIIKSGGSIRCITLPIFRFNSDIKL